MENTYWWKITEMNCKPKDGDLTDFVVTVHMDRLATDGTYNARWYGTQSFTSDNVKDFIPYEQLTYDIVCGWLNESINVSSIDAGLAQNIENQINPPIVTPLLPFTNPEPPSAKTN